MAGISLMQFFAKKPAAAVVPEEKQAAGDVTAKAPRLAAHTSAMPYRCACGALSEADIEAAMRSGDLKAAADKMDRDRVKKALAGREPWNRRRGKRRMKLVQLCDSVKPAYWGTFSTHVRKRMVNGRRPFGTDHQAFNYEVRSVAGVHHVGWAHIMWECTPPRQSKTFTCRACVGMITVTD